MIQIDWFDKVKIKGKPAIDYYWDKMKLNFIDNPDIIVWWRKGGQEYTINPKILLTETRDVVFAQPNVKLYVELRKHIEKKKNNSSLAEPIVLSQLKKDYPVFFGNYKGISDEEILKEIEKDLVNDDRVNYDKITDAVRRELMKSIGVNCCPYCNRQYITSLRKNAITIDDCSTADLDHFYNKEIFPLFSLSLFNFVPSCHVCNSTLKGTRWADMIYPYTEGFERDAVFKVDYKEITEDDMKKYLSGNGNFDLPIKIENNAVDPEKKKRIDKSIEIFYLDRVYESHEEFAKDILSKKHLYDENYIESIKNTLKDSDIKVTESSLNNLLYGYRMDKEDYDKNQLLSKLTHDLIFE